MSGQQRKRCYCLLLPILALAATAAGADPTASYVVDGSTGAALWGLGNQPGTQALVFAFSAATPVKVATAAAPGTPQDAGTPGPRVVFSVTQWAVVNNAWVEREWYGDWPLAPQTLAIAGDLTTGTLDTPLMGTLVERSLSGAAVQRDVAGRLQVTWTGSSDLTHATTQYTYQTQDYTTALQGVGTGRMASVTATVTVPALGDPIPLWGVGSLSSVITGQLSVTMQ
jgi:hypothetical protein